MIELLSCPFCGGECDPKGWMGQDKGGATTRGPECENCGATAMSVEAWNRRATQPAAGEPVLWQVRHCDPHRGWDEWTDVLPRSPALGETVADRLREYQDCIAHGGRYELRALGIVAPPDAAHGDEAVTNLVPGLQWAIDYCKAMQHQGNDRMLVEVIRKRLENVRDNQPAAIRAQGDGHD